MYLRIWCFGDKKEICKIWCDIKLGEVASSLQDWIWIHHDRNNLDKCSEINALDSQREVQITIEG